MFSRFFQENGRFEVSASGNKDALIAALRAEIQDEGTDWVGFFSLLWERECGAFFQELADYVGLMLD